MKYALIAYAIWLVIANVVTAFLYVYDKRAAQGHAAASNRVPERKLLLWSFLGGWPAALLVGQKIRHKTHKLAFRIPFYATIAANFSFHAVVAWFYFAK